jgi:hypothetical protein
MSLLQLLTTGKSLVGLKDSEPRYRMTHERMFPQFGPARNPFCTTEKPDATRAEACGRSEWAPVSSQSKADKAKPLPAHGPSVVPGAAASKSPALVLGSGHCNPADGVTSRAAALRTKWTEKLRTLLPRPAGKKVRLTLPAATRPHVQGELALDKIKVVRNDLSDADLEVVPAKLPAARAGITPASHAAEKTLLGGVPRGRLSGLFRMGRT